ncbi:unnamed protein product, partial [Effrenium voratum]
MLPHRIDFGLRGTSEPEVHQLLCQLVVLNGMITDANQPGTEKLCISAMNPAWATSPIHKINPCDFGADENLSPPGAAFCVKGWNRSVCCLGVLRAAFERKELFEVGHAHALIKKLSLSWGFQLAAGITLGSTSIRRKPNAFNLLHQCQFLIRAGVSEDSASFSLQATDSVNQFAAAYNVGRFEAGAAINLLKHVPHEVKNRLQSLVRFMHRHADADLIHLVEQTVPPADLTKVTVFASQLAKYQHKAQEDQISEAAKLSAQLLQTTWLQTELSIRQDLQLLKEWSARFDLFASQQAALDYKFINDRFCRGKKAIDDFQAKHHSFVNTTSLLLAHPEIVAKAAELGQTTLIIILADCTLWPKRTLKTICHHVCSMVMFHHLRQRPKQCRMGFRSMDIFELALNYTDSAHAGDRRKTSQQCIATVSGTYKSVPWTRSKALLGSITGIERARVCELANPEPDRPLAPHWRVQQRGVQACETILSALLDGMD